MVLATWEERAIKLDRAWALVILARCRGLLFAARGDLDGAFASFERALAEHARTTDPFHHARTLLARSDAHSGARRSAPPPARRSRMPSHTSSARRAAVGRADPRRARAHRRACALERRADRGRVQDRHACSRGPYEPERWRRRSSSPCTLWRQR